MGAIQYMKLRSFIKRCIKLFQKKNNFFLISESHLRSSCIQLPKKRDAITWWACSSNKNLIHRKSSNWKVIRKDAPWNGLMHWKRGLYQLLHTLWWEGTFNQFESKASKKHWIYCIEYRVMLHCGVSTQCGVHRVV